MNSGFICSDIHNALFELLSASEVKKISVCHVVSSITFESTGDAKRGGLHDPSMGPLDIRDFCTTCGGRSECPGHIGHIELELPVYHPLYIRQLVNLLKSICWHCCTLRMCQDTCRDYIKRLILLKESRYTDDRHFLSDHRTTTHAEYADNCSKLICDSNHRLNQPSNILSVDQKTKIFLNDDIDIRTFISSDGYALELWNNLRSEFFDKAIKQKACSNCGKSFRATVKESQLSIGITLSWPESSKSPIGLGSTWGNYNLKGGQIKIEDDFSSEIPDQAKIHTKKGQSLISQHFQAFQVIPILKKLWENNEKILEFLFPMSREISWEMFFMFVIPVPANKFRPLGALGGRNIPLLHPRTSALLDILVANERLRFYIDLQRQNKDKSTDDIDGNSSKSGLLSYVSSLQERVNSYLDKNKSFKPASTPPGIRQWLERKTGVIRQKMMGKRVNYSARTVIGPDPYLETNEIGIPLMFARNLTIPEYVGTHNVLIMCKLVENGTDHYPGATKLQLDGTLYDLSRLNISQRISKSKLLLSSVFTSPNPLIQNSHPIVFRQVIDGDVVLMNRQPTLHRPSIMAHFVRILPKDNIMRLNYVNCGTYNADFDGDEMNLHLPQSLSSRSEAKYIMDASQQYSVPKSGEPLRGLIQDSCIGGAFLTSKSTFLNREEYYHLLYTSLSFILDVKSSALSSLPIMYSANGHVIFGKNNTSSQLNTASGTVTIDETILRFQSHKNNRKELTSSINLDGVILEPPAIFKPIPLWTGKQVVTSMLKTFINKTSSSDRKIYAGVNLISKSRTPGDSWNGINDGDSEESTVIIRNSELLQGVIDKNQFGTNTYCLVHLCTDLFGPVIGGRLLSSFFYLSQAFLQMRGFTCSIGDMLLTLEAERRRKDIINKCTNASVFLQEAFSNLVLQRINNDYEVFSMEYSLPNIENKFTDQLKEICNFSNTFYTKFVESPKSQAQTLKIIIDKLSEYYKSNTDVDNKIMIRELTKYTNLFNFLNCNPRPTGLSAKIKSNYSKPCSHTLKDGSDQIPYYYQSWLVNRLENTTCPNNENHERNFFLVYPNEVTRRRVELVAGKLLSQTTSSVMKIIDTFYKMGIGSISSQVGEIVNGSSTFLPFPKNGFSSMVITGAKGSRVNHQMICAMLGQQELEGRRVPIMISMKSLPAFAPYDFGSRAGGFITDRYLDGLHAQEFFFHCMSGREGLVDTAVKTARSGYLQRCILKGLESMIVQYDGTVRSDDGSMIQFIYGEDGIDVSKCSYITRVDDLARNIELLSRSLNACEAKRNDVVKLSFSKVLEIEHKYGQFATVMNRSNKEKKAKSNSRRYFSWEIVKFDGSNTPITSVLPPAEYCGSVSESFVSNLTKDNLQRLSHLCNSHQSINTKVAKLEYKNKRKNGDFRHDLEELKNIEYLLRLKYSQTQVAPGEAVGCLAAQSIGEPATQMTLNTFHLAGHGAANVTLGIPRLKELLQTGGESKTPYSFIPLNVKESMNQLQAANVADQVLACFKSIPLTDIIAAIGIDNSIIYDCVGHYNNSKPSYCWRYDLSIQFEDLDSFCKVVPNYSISYIINQIFSKCLRPFLRQVNNMFILSCLKCRTNSRFSYLYDEVDEFTYKYIYGCRSYKEERRNIETYKGSSNNLSNIEQESNIDITESSQGNKEIENDYADVDTPREKSDGSSDSETEIKSIGTDDEYSDDEKIANINENSEMEVDGDGIVNEAKSEDISFSFADTEDLSSHAIRLKILSPILLRHVWDIKLSRLTNSLRVTIGWPIESCPNRIDLLPELSRCISKTHLRSVENLKNARITRGQQSEGNTLEVTVQGTNIGYIYNLSPDLVLHNNIRSNDIQTVYKYYGIEAARKCLINELTNVFAVYGINVDYRHLSLIGDAVTFSGSIRVFSRVGNVAHSTSPFLQMSFETSIKFLADACSRGAIDSLKSPASSISVGKICSVGTGLSRIFTIVNHSNKSNVFKEINGEENDHKFRFVSN
ncbi:putative DNA-directed RNA polymerase I largest subunit [Cryptosporidium serpentis]